MLSPVQFGGEGKGAGVRKTYCGVSLKTALQSRTVTHRTPATQTSLQRASRRQTGAGGGSPSVRAGAKWGQDSQTVEKQLNLLPTVPGRPTAVRPPRRRPAREGGTARGSGASGSWLGVGRGGRGARRASPRTLQPLGTVSGTPTLKPTRAGGCAGASAPGRDTGRHPSPG